MRETSIYPDQLSHLQAVALSLRKIRQASHGTEIGDRLELRERYYQVRINRGISQHIMLLDEHRSSEEGTVVKLVVLAWVLTTKYCLPSRVGRS